jgi:hypothetical protein
MIWCSCRRRSRALHVVIPPDSGQAEVENEPVIVVEPVDAFGGKPLQQCHR